MIYKMSKPSENMLKSNAEIYQLMRESAEREYRKSQSQPDSKLSFRYLKLQSPHGSSFCSSNPEAKSFCKYQENDS